MSSTPSTSDLHVIVIGAGTGGLALAHGLKRAGISVSVHERDRTRRDGLQGYRVGIDPDGSRALHDCLPPETFDTFVATCARTPRYFTMLTERLGELLALDGWADTEADPLDSEKSVSRMTLRQVLLTGLDDVVHFDRTCTGYRHEADGSVTACFADGTTATGTLLVAADGSRSAVRRQYLPHATLTSTGLVGITGKLPLTPDTAALLTPTMRAGVSMVMAPRGYSCIVHVMEFPWDADGAPKNGIGATDAELISAWPGLNFDNTRDYIGWGFGGAAGNLPPDVLRMGGAELHRLVTGLTARWHPDLRELIALTDPNTCFPLDIRTSAPIGPWQPSNVTLLGDAIHTMTPGRGVGANTALRDARLLCRELTAVRDGRTTLVEAVGAYESAMVEYGFDAVAKSLKFMDGNDPIHRPVVGRAVLALQRTGMRTVNHLPPLRRKMAAAQQSYRGRGRED